MQASALKGVSDPLLHKFWEPEVLLFPGCSMLSSNNAEQPVTGLTDPISKRFFCCLWRQLRGGLFTASFRQYYPCSQCTEPMQMFYAEI